MEIHELWDEPWESLPPDEAAYDWDEVSAEENGPTKNAPNQRGRWIRWYFTYHKPSCTMTRSVPTATPIAANGLIRTPRQGSHDMIRRRPSTKLHQDETALRRRVFNFFRAFERGNTEKCFEYLDPQLVKDDKVAPDIYARSLHQFVDRYGKLDIRHVDTRFVPAGSKRDPRPFAYVLVFWVDARHEPHVFRERWVKEGEQWFTRVVGYVAHGERPAGAEI